MDCPACKTERLVMSERQGIEIDYCPQCRGVWLDRGELDKIIERSQNGTAAAAPTPMTVNHQQTAPRYPHESNRDYGHGKKHQPKSIWKELFD
ncbi:zf-TFIIB domain-containing protein [Chitinibacter tainanensis]|uniref:TFIIB-type zinc ribbon-containing protein n=1 Tax=Chitinibacter tainanensis TaxID=230667 RepID=UPI002353A538|nr:zf-TFIIB domain-containing protein [Chitinibacter tainanensis]